MGVQWIDSVVRKYRDLAMVVSQRGWRLQGEDEPESIFDILEQLSSDADRRLGQEITIDRDDLGDVGDGILGKTGGFGRYEDVAWRVNEPQI